MESYYKFLSGSPQRHMQGTHAGKLKGAMLAHTPRGSFRVSVSMSLLTVEIVRQQEGFRKKVQTFDLLAKKGGGYAASGLNDLQPSKNVSMCI